jgi:hypothetical protein
MKTNLDHYLFDLGPILKERALEAKRARDAELPDTLEREFKAGRVLGLAEAISILQQQAEGLGINLQLLRLDGFDPDRALV